VREAHWSALVTGITSVDLLVGEISIRQTCSR
jgi:hypothetical protein